VAPYGGHPNYTSNTAVRCGVVGVTDKTLSVRVDQSTQNQLSNESINTSGLVRSLLTNYFQTGDTVEASLQKQLADLEEKLNALEMEKTQLEQRIKKKEREIDQVQHRLKQRRENVPEEVEEFAEKINAGKFPLGNLEPENPAVQNHAEKAGLPDPETFISKVRDYL